MVYLRAVFPLRIDGLRNVRFARTGKIVYLYDDIPRRGVPFAGRMAVDGVSLLSNAGYDFYLLSHNLAAHGYYGVFRRACRIKKEHCAKTKGTGARNKRNARIKKRGDYFYVISSFIVNAKSRRLYVGFQNACEKAAQIILRLLF